MHDLVALNCGITFFVEVLTHLHVWVCVLRHTMSLILHQVWSYHGQPRCQWTHLSAELLCPRQCPAQPFPARPRASAMHRISPRQNAVSRLWLKRWLIDWLKWFLRVLDGFGMLWLWIAIIWNNVLISATDISFSRLLPTFQYTLRLWGSNLDVSCFLSSGGGTASCSNATLHWWWWANRLRSQRPRHPKGSWPVLHEVPQIERVRHPAGHKVCSYMQARNGMLTDLHAHLAQLLSMPAYISNSSHILYCMWSSHSLICPFLHAVLHDKSKH